MKICKGQELHALIGCSGLDSYSCWACCIPDATMRFLVARFFFFLFFFCCIPSLLPMKLVDCADRRCGSRSRAGLWRRAAMFYCFATVDGRCARLIMDKSTGLHLFWSVYYGQATVGCKRGDAKMYSLLSTRDPL